MMTNDLIMLCQQNIVHFKTELMQREATGSDEQELAQKLTYGKENP